MISLGSWNVGHAVSKIHLEKLKNCDVDMSVATACFCQ